MSEGIIRQLEQAVIEGLPEDAVIHANQAIAWFRSTGLYQ